MLVPGLTILANVYTTRSESLSFPIPFHFELTFLLRVQDFSFQGSEDINVPGGSTPPRFTRTADTFCIVAFDRPTNGQLVINRRLPVLSGDEIRLLGPNPSQPLPWSVDASTGRLTVDISQAMGQIDTVQFGWAFQVVYKLAA